MLCFQNQNRGMMDLNNDFPDSNPICGLKLWLVLTFIIWKHEWVSVEFKAWYRSGNKILIQLEAQIVR